MKQVQEMSSQDETMPLKTVRELLGKSYYIPNYQRGYRWGKLEVIKLLDDIWDFANNMDKKDESEFYCLQPLIVRPLSNDGEAFNTEQNLEGSESKDCTVYEVLDGQQRLTTLNLLIHYINEIYRGKNKYPEMVLNYQTRPESSEAINSLSIDKDNNVCMAVKARSIDFWHIEKAYCYIHGWFEKQGTGFNDSSFQDILLEKVKVIWYEIEANEEPIKVFERNNIGKISLTDVELIKALILKEEDKADTNYKRRQLEIAQEWDRIEQGLRNPSLWAFIFGKKPMPEVCMEQLFVVVLGLEGENKTKPFDNIEKKIPQEEDCLTKLWQEVQELYSMIVDWYNNHKLYHYIGFLIQEGVSVQNIYKLSKNSEIKSQFEEKLREEIAKVVQRTQIHYTPEEGFFCKKGSENKDLYKECKGGVFSLLLLYNISLCLREGSTERFPFACLQKGGEKRVQWNIEHIDSQTPNELTAFKDQKLWLETTQNALEGKIDEQLSDEIKGYLAQEDDSQNTFDELRERLRKLADEKEDLYSHSLGNLALLDSSTNQSYKNALFIVKRETLEEREKNGLFIPQGTKVAFMKYFSGATTNLDKWSEEDKKAHEAYIYSFISKYYK
jgi:conserved hypothetical protein